MVLAVLGIGKARVTVPTRATTSRGDAGWGCRVEMQGGDAGMFESSSVPELHGRVILGVWLPSHWRSAAP